MTTLKLQSAAAIGKMVDTVIKASVDLDPAIHNAAVQCLMHAEKHGDTTLADRLIKGLGKSVRVEGLRLWFHDFSPIRWNGDGKVGQLKAGQKDFKAYDAKAADENPFYSYAPAGERTARPISFDTVLKLIDNLPDRVVKAVEKGQFEGNATRAANFASAVKAFADKWAKDNPEPTEQPKAGAGTTIDNAPRDRTASDAPRAETTAQRAPRRRVTQAA